MTISTPHDHDILGQPYQVVIQIDKTGKWDPKLDDLAKNLRETANCPIIIDWTPGNLEEHVVFPDARGHTAILLEHLHRWREISIYVGYMPVDSFSHMRGIAGELETVFIQAPNSAFDTPGYSQQISCIWAKAPKFRSYTIKNCYEEASKSQVKMSTLRLPYANLTTLRIDTVLPLDECVTVMAAATQLLHCRFGSIAGPNTAPPTSPLVHKTLQSLFIVSCWEDHDQDLQAFAHCLLGHVRTPALRRLVVENDSRWDSDLFEQFIADSNCKLEALEFHTVKVSGHLLIGILKTHCPNIRAFKIFADESQEPPPISRAVWELLRCNEGDTHVFLPKLALLFVNEAALVDAPNPDLELAAVVASRRNKGLEVVWFQTDDEEASLNGWALKNMFPPGDFRSRGALKDLVIDEGEHPELWNDCVNEYLWPTGCGWRRPDRSDENDIGDMEDMEDMEDMDSDSDEDSEAGISDMDCD